MSVFEVLLNKWRESVIIVGIGIQTGSLSSEEKATLQLRPVFLTVHSFLINAGNWCEFKNAGSNVDHNVKGPYNNHHNFKLGPEIFVNCQKNPYI